jgi:MFS family permease
VTTAELVRLRRHFVALTFLRWFPTGLLIPVLVLLMVGRGLSLPTIGAVFAAYGAVTLLLELPTGGLADVVGRRTVLVAAELVTIASMFVMAVGQTVPVLLAGTMLAGVGRALGSGPLEAWYVDAAHAVDPLTDLKPALARAGVAGAVGLALGALAGGAVVAVTPLPDSGHAVLLSVSVPYLVAAGFGLVHLTGIVTWVRDRARSAPRPSWRAVLRDVPRTVVAGGRLVSTNRVLRRISLRAAVMGVVLTTAEMLSPVQFEESIGADGYAVLVTAAFLGTAAGSHLGPLVGRVSGGTSRGIATATVLGAVGIAGLALPAWWAAAAAYVFLYVSLGLDVPLLGELLHAETASDQRATVISVQSLVLQGGGAVGNLVVPLLAAATSFRVAWLVIAAVCLGSTLLAVGLPRGRVSIPTPESLLTPPDEAAVPGPVTP